MPYIHPADRSRIDAGIQKPASKGDLNYAITSLMVNHIRTYGRSYHIISDAIAAAQDAADEMKRRILGPYEDEKRKQNGDVYTDIL